MLSVLLICLQIARVAYINDSPSLLERIMNSQFVGTKNSRGFGNIYGISADIH